MRGRWAAVAGTILAAVVTIASPGSVAREHPPTSLDRSAVSQASASIPGTTTTLPVRVTASTVLPTTSSAAPVSSTTTTTSVQPRPDMASALAAVLDDPRLSPNRVSAEVQLAGRGYVFGHEAELRLLPASNEKILTAVGALELLPPDHVFTTRVLVTETGDLVLVPGGDPTLTRSDLDRLAVRVAAAGILDLPGDLIVDVTHFDAASRAPGWQDWHVPRWTGPLSTLIVDRNRARTDPAFLADPDLANAELFRSALGRQGVEVGGDLRIGPTPTDAGQVAVHESPPVVDLVADMLRTSNNETAESLIREVGFVAAGDGSTTAGTRATIERLASLGIDFRGTMADGSGMSRGDASSASDLVAVLRAARTAEWYPAFAAGLPVAGESGTLSRRLGDPATRGLVRAKTGTIIGGVALAGYVPLADGEEAVFAILVNGDTANTVVDLVDRFVVAIATG